jgi:hypothetical protein
LLLIVPDEVRTPTCEERLLFLLGRDLGAQEPIYFDLGHTFQEFPPWYQPSDSNSATMTPQSPNSTAPTLQSLGIGHKTGELVFLILLRGHGTTLPPSEPQRSNFTICTRVSQ